MLGSEGCADEAQPYAIEVSFRKHVGHDRLSPEIGTPTPSARAAAASDGDGQGRRMGKVSLGEQRQAPLADIDGADPLIEACPA